MAIDPAVSLASSLHAGPATFALLVGSGISMASGVMSGWHVAVDLARRLAVTMGEDPDDDPVGWYRAHAGGDPDYSQLLDGLAPSLADRRNLLQSYFEPTVDERAEGKKQPTQGHRAIADLVAGGYVRVIITTNFDRLLETALIAAGIQPQVISSPTHAAGATPLVHSRCSIIKVHGDYLSPDLKNTVEELSTYDPAIDTLLDEVLDQYGLVVCGWSAIWDHALRNAILRAPSRRCATYWAHRGDLAAEAADLVAHRGAIDTPIADADSFFLDIADKVAALADAVDQRPQTTALAVAQLKRYLPDATHRIRLHDLVMTEVDKVLTQVNEISLEPGWSSDRYRERIQIYEHATATLTSLLTTGAYFGDSPTADNLWRLAIERLAYRRVEHTGLTALINVQYYPVTLALYALGLGAVAAERVDPFASVLAEVGVPDLSDAPLPVTAKTAATTVFQGDAFKESYPDVRQRPTAASDRLYEVLRPAASGVLPDDDRYGLVFDRVEYVLALTYGAWRDGMWFPIGRSVWRHRESIEDAVAPYRQALLGAGLFEASTSKLDELIASYIEHVGRSGLGF